MQCDLLQHFRKKKRQDRNTDPKDSPLQVQLIKFLGLKNYFVDKFIFRRKPSKYTLSKLNNQNCLLLPGVYQPPAQLDLTVKLLESPCSSTPIVFLKHKKPHDDFIIIYSHGNASDMSDGLNFLENLALTYKIDVLGYDYSGYGESRVSVIGEETIVRDLELVIAWLNRPIGKIILWGFSLGSYPAVCSAAKYQNIAGMVLQCPIASINCLFEKNLYPGMQFKEDHFSNLQKIADVRCMSFIVHSMDDQMIPVTHSRLLFETFAAVNGKDKIWFLEVNKLNHNSIHKYFISKTDNDLKVEFREFLREIRKKAVRHHQPRRRIADRCTVMETELDEDDLFFEEDYELTTLMDSSDVSPSRRSSNYRRTIPRCFSSD